MELGTLYLKLNMVESICQASTLRVEFWWISTHFRISYLRDICIELKNLKFEKNIYMGRDKIVFFKWCHSFPHIDAFWCLCSRQLFEKMVTKEEIAQIEQFLILSPCFPLYSIIVFSSKRHSQIKEFK